MNIKTRAFFRKYFTLFISIIILLIIGIPNLGLPFYWDELWSYAPAIFKMSEEGPSLLPGGIIPYFYRGHPLLFYFIMSAWIKIFGSKIFIVKILPLLISVATQTATFLFCKKVFNQFVANISILLITSQSIFLAQSTQMLPEMMIALLTVISIWMFFTEKYWVFSLSSAALMLTKESGIIIYISLFIAFIALKRQQIFTNRLTFKQLFFISISALPVMFFFILQKIKLGWFFFPEHMNMQVKSFGEFTQRASNIFQVLTNQIGIKYITFVAILVLIYSIINKQNLFINLKIILITLFTILSYFLFSAYNFFTFRYILAVLPLLIILLVYIISQVKLNQFIHLSIFLSIFTMSLYEALTEKNISDTSLGYKDQVRTMKQTVKYCEENIDSEASINATFLMIYALSDKNLGYLSKQGKEYSNLSINFDEKREYFVTCNPDNSVLTDNLVKDSSYKIIYEKSIGNCWSRVYKKDK